MLSNSIILLNGAHQNGVVSHITAAERGCARARVCCRGLGRQIVRKEVRRNTRNNSSGANITIPCLHHTLPFWSNEKATMVATAQMVLVMDGLHRWIGLPQRLLAPRKVPTFKNKF